MRTQLLCTSALVLAASALLCGPEVARAQTGPAYPNGYYQGYGYRPAPSPYAYTGYTQAAGSSWSTPYAGAYANYPNYYNPNAANASRGYYGYPYWNPQTTNAWSQQPAAPAPTDTTATAATADAAAGQSAAPAADAAADTPAGTPPAVAAAEACLPALPPDLDGPPPGDDGHDKKEKARGHGWFDFNGKDCFWVSADYDIAFIKPLRTSTPLVTTGATADLHPGALSQPSTAVLFGGNDVDFGMMSGMRGEVGVYLDGDHCLSLDWGGLWLFPSHVRYDKASDAAGNPLITRPFFNVVTGSEAAFIDAMPGVASGSVSADVRSELFDTEVNGRLNMNAPEGGAHADLLVGFRYLRLQEQLNIHDQLSPLVDNVLTFQGSPVNAPDSLTDTDSFHTTNNFYGLQLGGRFCWDCGWCYLGLFGKVALGANDEEVQINGSTTLVTPFGNQTARGGVLALPSNIGTYDRTVLTFVPEGGLSVGVRLSKCLRLSAGYSFLYWNNVVRPGAQIDRFVNATSVPTDTSFGQSTGAVRPVFRFNDESFWVHSLNFGLDFQY